MKIIIYPADKYGCGHHRLIWPAEILKAQGHDITVIIPEDRSVSMTMQGNKVVDATIPKDTDVVIFQRTTHQGIPSLINWCNEQGIATVLEIDDDLQAVHPSNPAAKAINLRYGPNGKPNLQYPSSNVKHSWRYFIEACKRVTLIQCATPELAKIYGGYRPIRVIRNYLHSSYYTQKRIDSDLIGWPASIHSHPNDPQVMGTTMRTLIADGADFVVMSELAGVENAFSLQSGVRTIEHTPLDHWPEVISKLGIGIIPLANSRFNRSKSWLKGLELCATGVPWVASPRLEYKELNALGAGRLAAKPSDWLIELTTLWESSTLRQELSEAGRDVADKLKLDDHVWRWLEVWTEAFNLRKKI